MAYLLDANVFIQAKNLHYGLDFCPAFWEWLVAKNAAELCKATTLDENRKHGHVLTAAMREQQAEGLRLDKATAANLTELGYDR